MQDEDLKFYKTVGKILKEQRKKRGLKFTIFCYENDIAKSSLNLIEKGSSQAYFSKIAKVVKSLGLSFEEFGKILDEELTKTPLDKWVWENKIIMLSFVKFILIKGQF